jgi:hypothetical protein
MSIQVSCAGCGKSYRVDDRFAGKRAKCKACGNEMLVPAAAAAAPRVAAGAGAAPAPAKTKVAAAGAAAAKPAVRKPVQVEKSGDDFDFSAIDAIEQGGEVDDNYVAPVAVATSPDASSSRRKGTAYNPGTAAAAEAAAAGSASKSSPMMLRIAIGVALAAALGVTAMLIRGIFHTANSTKTVAAGDDLDKDPSLSLGEKMAIRHQRQRDADKEAASWREVEKVTVPQRKEFPELTDKDTSDAEVDQFNVTLSGQFQGEPISMEIYVPVGQHAPKSMACILGTPLEAGVLQGYARGKQDWQYKQLAHEIGQVVVSFDLSKWGMLNRPENLEEGPLELMQTDCAYHCARDVIELCLARLPMIDPGRLYVMAPNAGGRMALYWATLDPRIRAVATWDPVCDVMAGGGEWGKGLHIRGIEEFMKKTSPVKFADKIKCPVLIMMTPRPKPATKVAATPKSAADNGDGDDGDDSGDDSLGSLLGGGGGRELVGVKAFKAAMQKAGNPVVEQELKGDFKAMDFRKQTQAALNQMGAWLRALPSSPAPAPAPSAPASSPASAGK